MDILSGSGREAKMDFSGVINGHTPTCFSRILRGQAEAYQSFTAKERIVIQSLTSIVSMSYLISQVSSEVLLGFFLFNASFGFEWDRAKDLFCTHNRVELQERAIVRDTANPNLLHPP